MNFRAAFDVFENRKGQGTENRHKNNVKVIEIYILMDLIYAWE